jgi:hypothetical protein
LKADRAKNKMVPTEMPIFRRVELLEILGKIKRA